MYRNSRGTVRSGLRRTQLLYGIQQPTHWAFPELFAADGRSGSLRRDFVAAAGHHHAVQLRATAEKHYKVHARQLESSRLHPTDTAVHQANARQQNLSASKIMHIVSGRPLLYKVLILNTTFYREKLYTCTYNNMHYSRDDQTSTMIL